MDRAVISLFLLFSTFKAIACSSIDDINNLVSEAKVIIEPAEDLLAELDLKLYEGPGKVNAYGFSKTDIDSLENWHNMANFYATTVRANVSRQKYKKRTYIIEEDVDIGVSLNEFFAKAASNILEGDAEEICDILMYFPNFMLHLNKEVYISKNNQDVIVIKFIKQPLMIGVITRKANGKYSIEQIIETELNEVGE
ncbi:hypothetical protein [Shewanella cyperi]|uniref:hypothetical protein n=1 Tax=Shewanella cyperi TaxID=2814292 RepID=UPI001A941142|nr:hypothetical protein [Shewanella cyperi]QSX41437.1 hypothetical protein JYB84_03090 [Shewanella cyperi]